MMTLRQYGLYGWRVSSARRLGPVALGGAPGEPDLVFSAVRTAAVPTSAPEGVVLAEYPSGNASWKLYWLTGHDRGYVLRLPGYAEFRVSLDIKRVACWRAPHVPWAEVREFFCGNGMSLLLSLSGAAVFHAAGVAFAAPRGPAGWRAVGIFGGSGAGKSTLAATLVGHGARFLTDDVLRVGNPEGVPSAVGGCAELRLRGEAAGLAELFPTVPRRPTADGRTALALGDGCTCSVPLKLLLFPRLADGPDGQMALSTMGPRETALRLAGAPRMTGWSWERVLTAQFDCLAQLARSVRAVKVEVPRSIDSAAGLGRALAEQLRVMVWEG
jgi:hypothetical protein